MEERYSQSGSKREPHGPHWFIFLIALIVVLILWAGNWYILVDLEPDVRGTIGDMFGAVNALFSGLAFAGVAYAIFLQRHELKETKNALQMQNRQAEKRDFEQTFFHMFELLNLTLGAPRAEEHGIMVEGRHALSAQMSYFRERRDKGYKFKDAFAGLRSRYVNLDVYVRGTEAIIALIQGSDVKNKALYVDILRSQLSSAEQDVLYVYSESEAFPMFTELVRKYDLLTNVRISDAYCK